MLFGDASPSGRLPVSFPFNNYTSQSDFYDMSMRRWPGRTHRHLQARGAEGPQPGRRGACFPKFRLAPGTTQKQGLVYTRCVPVLVFLCTQHARVRTRRPAVSLHVPPAFTPQVPVLYEFGHGLSYTSFSYSTLRAEVPTTVAPAAPLSRQADGLTALLHVSVDVVNAGGMPADEVVLLFLSFPEDDQYERQPPQRQHSGRRPWLPWRWWQPAAASIPALGLSSVTLTLPCVGGSYGSGRSSSSVHSSGSRLGGSVWPEDVPRQTLAGFERLFSLEPRQSATARFTLTLATFRPFSPPESSGMVRAAAVRPYCGRYVLQAGSQQLEVWVEDEEAAAAAL